MKIGLIRSGTAALATIAAVALGGCTSNEGTTAPRDSTAGSSSNSPAHTLGKLTACQLLRPYQIGQIGFATLFSPLSAPHPDGQQCDYTTANGVALTIARGMPMAQGGTLGLISGAASHEIGSENDDTCAVDVALVDNDPAQVLSVKVILHPSGPLPIPDQACEFADTIARAAVDNLPS